MVLAHARRKFVETQKVQPKGKTGRADIELKLISKLYGTEIAYKQSSDEARKKGRQDLKLKVLGELKAWMLKNSAPHDYTKSSRQSGRLLGKQLEKTRAVR